MDRNFVLPSTAEVFHLFAQPETALYPGKGLCHLRGLLPHLHRYRVLHRAFHAETRGFIDRYVHQSRFADDDQLSIDLLYREQDLLTGIQDLDELMCA